MENNSFTKLKEEENLLKVDKDLIEIQKTIIFYGDKIIFKLDKIIELIEGSYKKNKEATTVDKNGSHESLAKLLINMKIPKGYREN